jgi:nucleoside-diphosphate-sugar epimerase
VKRIIYASSSSVYGVKEQPDVRESDPPDPLTDYSRFKLECEHILMEQAGGMTRVIVRPATVCGYAPRLRLDLTVNILTIHALVNRKIRIFGGKQMRPNLHILDMVRAYEMFLAAPAEKIDGVPFNVGFENRPVEDIAKLVKRVIGDEGIALEYVPTDDNRSYHINSDRVRQALGFVPKYTIEDAVSSIAEAYRAGKIPDAMTNPMYQNIKRMHQLALG